MLLQGPVGSQSADLSSTAAKGWTRDPAENPVSSSSSIPLSILYRFSMTKDDGSRRIIVGLTRLKDV